MINGIDIPVSIKCCKLKSSIDFGDLKRQINITNNFILYVGFWKIDKYKIYQEYKLLIKKQYWTNYFGNVNIISDMLNDMKNISNNKIDDNNWKRFIYKYKELYGNSIISLRFKRDHKKQKRIQCGIMYNNFIYNILKDNEILSKNNLINVKI